MQTAWTDQKGRPEVQGWRPGVHTAILGIELLPAIHSLCGGRLAALLDWHRHTRTVGAVHGGSIEIPVGGNEAL